MSISASAIFKNIGHFFAVAVSKIFIAAPKIDAEAQKINTAVQNSAAGVEAITSIIPTYGPAAVTIEKAAVMVLGAVVGVIHAGDAAIEQKLLDLGLDQTAVQTAVDVYQKLPAEVKAIVS